MKTEVIDVLTQLYIDDPAGAQPTALWKIFDMYENVHYELQRVEDQITYLKVETDEVLIAYYSVDKTLSIKDISPYKLALVNSKYLKGHPINAERYFKKIFRFDHNYVHLKKDAISFKNINVQEEFKDIAEFINDCYDDINVSNEAVIQWTQRHVYDKDLWIWLVDSISGKSLALGIGEIDQTIGEGSLEWIQVHPTNHNKGYGKLLVNELQHRMKNKVEFITVAGKLDNTYNPAKLYERCGFTGQDVWLIIR